MTMGEVTPHSRASHRHSSQGSSPTTTLTDLLTGLWERAADATRTVRAAEGRRDLAHLPASLSVVPFRG